MAVIDVEALLAPLADMPPCGADLEYEGVTALEEMAAIKPERQMGNVILPAEEPDWRAVRRHSDELWQQTRDLRVASRLALALLATEGWQGWADGLSLMQGLLTQWWDDVHPRLDPADGYDPTIRVSAIGYLAEPGMALRMLRLLPLASSRQLGRFSYRDVLMARGDIAAREGETVLEESMIAAICANADPSHLNDTAALIQAAQTSAEAIDAFIQDKDGGQPLEALRKLLREMHRVLAVYVTTGVDAAAGEAVQDSPATSEAGHTASSGTADTARVNEVATRADAIVALDRLVDWFQRNEPSSPVPILLARARGLIGKDFLAIVDDLVPAGREQIDVFRGRVTNDTDGYTADD